MPITPRLQCWFGETSLAKLLMGVNLEISDGLIKDFQDGQEYIKLLIVLQDIKMWARRIVFFLVYRWPEPKQEFIYTTLYMAHFCDFASVAKRNPDCIRTTHACWYCSRL